jgi:hypothetical protein
MTGRWSVKNKLWVVLLGLAVVAGLRGASGEEAGTYLVYDVGGTPMRLLADADRFSTTIKYANDDSTFGGDEPATPGTAVDTRLRTPSGGIFELGLLGLLWVPPGNVREGGSAHGTRVSEVRRWEAWEVGVVTASVGIGGALRGEWYYDTQTGFLVGGMRGTAVTEGQAFTLTASNLPGLAF